MGVNRRVFPAVSGFRNALGDARFFQILFLGVLLSVGAWRRDFSLHPAQIALTFSSALLCQNLAERVARRPIRSLRSSIITSLGITLLLRAGNLWAHPLAAAVAILSKFLVRFRGKHLFNPANLGVLFALAFLPGTWVSAGQWGQQIALAGWIIALGGVVTNRARSADISWIFLGCYVAALALRVMWLGQRWAVLGHQLSNGALLLFAFFMISDPMTIPSHRRGRAVHAALVCAAAYLWQFCCYRTNGLLWALLLAAPTVPIWDALWPAPKFEWISQGGSNHVELEETTPGADRDRPDSWPGDRAA